MTPNLSSQTQERYIQVQQWIESFPIEGLMKPLIHVAPQGRDEVVYEWWCGGYKKVSIYIDDLGTQCLWINAKHDNINDIFDNEFLDINEEELRRSLRWLTEAP